MRAFLLLMILSLPLLAEETFCMIKPNAVEKNHVGEIIHRFENNGFKIKALRMTELSKIKAERFYEEHRERPFFNDLIEFMTSGPVVAMILEKESAIADARELIGATKDPAPGTIRADFADSVTENAIHGSDKPESAGREIAILFPLY